MKITKKMVLMCAVLLASTAYVAARSLKTIRATYTYAAPENISIEQARRTASEKAKIQALAEEFGTTIIQINDTRIRNNSGGTSTDFSSLSTSEVKGEWIETLYEKFETPVFSDGQVFITCHITGTAREVTSESVDYKVHILRNGIEDRCENDEFHVGDDIYISFTAPMDGFLAIYLVDGDEVYCTLPYRNQTNGIYKIRANKRYVLFHTASAQLEEKMFVDEYKIISEQSMEQNLIYVIFSPNPFSKGVDKYVDDELPRMLSYADFNKWMAKCKTRDRSMTICTKPITIVNK